MTVRAWLVALVAVLALAPLSAAQGAQTPVGDVAARIDHDGPPVGIAAHSGSSVGDSSVDVRQQVRDAVVVWRGAPGPVRLDVEVGLRGLVVRSPVLPALGALVAHEGDARPAVLAGVPWPYIGPDGIDITYDLDGHARHVGDGGWPAVIYPDTWYGIDMGVGYQGAHLPMVFARSSDEAVDAVAGSAAYACIATDTEFDLGLGAVCTSRAGLVQSLTPTVNVVSQLPGVAAHVLPQGVAFSSAGGPHAVPRGLLAPPAANGAPPGIRAPERLGAVVPVRGEPLLAPGLASAEPRAAPLATQWSSGADWMLQPLQGATPAVLAALALLAPLWMLYRRLSTPDALLHPLREDMLLRIRAKPGIHESQLAREMGLRHTHVQYHLRVLRQSRIIEERRFGGLKCLFEVGRLSEAEKGLAMNERGRGPAVLQGVVTMPGITQRDLARQLGMSESSVKWHLDRLTQAGMVRTDRARGSKRAWPEPLVAAKPPAVAPAVPAGPALVALTVPLLLPPGE